MLKKVINKVPGNIPPPPKKENQGYIEDLGKKQKFELEELLERQNKILANNAFTLKLPDKGERIKAFRDKILKEIKCKNEVEQAANLLSRLNLASEGKAAMNELEWTGNYNETKDTVKIVELDSDDEEDPLKILAQVSEKEKKREPFKPYRTTKSNVHDPEKEKQRKSNKNWEVTAATPPNTVHGAVKVINLNESLRLQKDHAEKLQKIQTKHAAERLAEQLGLHTIGLPSEYVNSYRLRDEKNSSSSSEAEDEEEHEVHDDEDNDKGGTVVFTVDSIEH
ncbi:hypothetical protein WN55_01534 [Dufourea novaeangliae]|uniref:Uncharacterized protein n=1 Tax=Dufourea novaeangliae TaxID=178035 RepID=A0A154PG54_DUFNO|nr:hypothetical protein WN55_01534 [Dufourea novaeangliae]